MTDEVLLERTEALQRQVTDVASLLSGRRKLG